MIPLIVGAALAAGQLMQGANASEKEHNAISNAKKSLSQIEGFNDQMKTEGQQVLQGMLDANQTIYGTPEQASLALKQAQAGLNGVNPYQAGEFNYNKSIDDFYDKALGIRMNSANDAIHQSQALGGSLFSSDTANKLTAQAQVLGSQAYNDALTAYQTDKGLEQSIWQGNESARQAAANSALGLAQAKYGMASDTAGNISSAQNGYYQSLMGLTDDYWQNKSDYAKSVAELDAQDPGHREWYKRLVDPMALFT